MGNMKLAYMNAVEGKFDPFTTLLAVTEQQGGKFGKKEELETLNVGGTQYTTGQLDHADEPVEELEEEEMYV